MSRNSKRQQGFGFSSEKIFYRIGDVAGILGVETCVLRYWESEFDVLSPRRARSGQRIYTAEDISILLHIKKLLYEERYTIDGAKKKLAAMLPEIKKQAAAGVQIPREQGSEDVIGMVQKKLRRMLEDLS